MQDVIHGLQNGAHRGYGIIIDDRSLLVDFLLREAITMQNPATVE